MKTSGLLLTGAALLALIASCATPKKQMADNLDEVGITCNPEVLVVKSGKIDATITMSFPADYFYDRATLVVTPVLVYEGGQRTGEPTIYQGEKVKANYITIPKSGKLVRKCVSFDYAPGMELCHLELRCVLIYGEKKINIPAIKLADGCNSTYLLAVGSGEMDEKSDGFQLVTEFSTETSIMFDVNSAYVKNNSQNNTAISLYKSYIKELEQDERYRITGTEIVAYASPEGGVELNQNLSERRADAAVKTWKKSSGIEADTIAIRSMGQDWEGFKEAMANSDIEDKDLILRVLSMYSDPAVRESEIRNLSFIYDDIKNEVFPGLRRATFVVSAEHTGYSDEELLELAQTQLALLTEPEVLHLASITGTLEGKKFYNRLAAERFKSETGYYNLAYIALLEDKKEVAAAYLDRCPGDKDALNLRGVIELRYGNYAEARKLFKEAGTPAAMKNLGTISILEGDYEAAAKQLEGSGSVNEVLALILAGQAEKAASIASCDTPREAYIAAVAAARLGNADRVKGCLIEASKDADYAKRATKDVEFVDFR